VFDDGYSP